MAVCDIGRLDGSSKATVGIMILVALVGGGVVGGLLGHYVIEPEPRLGTTVNVTISPDFYVTIVEGETITSLADSSFACNALMIEGILFGTDTFNALLEYMASNPSYIFDPDTAAETIGLESVESGMEIMAISNSFLSFGTASIDTILDGKTFTMDFGDTEVIPGLQVFTYYEESLISVGFMFEENIDFINHINDDTANYEVFSEAIFMNGLGNDLLINGMVYDTVDYTLSTLIVEYNGVAFTMSYSSMF